MGRTRSWEVSDEFWKRVAPVLPRREREPKAGLEKLDTGISGDAALQ